MATTGALGSNASVLRISRPRLPQPITPQRMGLGAVLYAVAGAAGAAASAASSTLVPRRVTRVPRAPPRKNSRRFKSNLSVCWFMDSGIQRSTCKGIHGSLGRRRGRGIGLAQQRLRIVGFGFTFFKAQGPTDAADQ